MDWIRWTTKAGSVSLWHRAYRGTRMIRTRTLTAGAFNFQVPPARRDDPIWPSQLEITDEPSRGAIRFRPHTNYRRTACGFTVPPYESMDQWSGEGLPEGPRCIWCVHGWTVDVAPPSGTPPRAPVGPRSGPLPPPKKRPPTLHA